MKYIRQFMIILLVALTAEGLEYFLPLPVPASIYGLGLMLFLLISGLIRVEQIRETAAFLVEIMPVLFIPPAVGLMESYTALEGIFWPMAASVVITTVVVMAVTGRSAQAILRRTKRDGTGSHTENKAESTAEKNAGHTVKNTTSNTTNNRTNNRTQEKGR